MVFCHSVYSVISDLMIAEPLSKTWLRLDFEMPSIVRWSLESAVTFSFKKRDLVAPKWQNLFIKNHFVYYCSSKTGFFSLQVTKSQPMMHNINCHLFRNVSQAVYFCLVNIKQWMTSPKIKTQGSTYTWLIEFISNNWSYFPGTEVNHEISCFFIPEKENKLN